jgi:tetratricopeptide (TPR) repeat protein
MMISSEMRSCGSCVAATFLIALLCAARVTHADPFEPPASLPQAQDHYTHGKSLFRAKQYADAAAEFAVAYQIDPSAKFLLFNLALARRMAGSCADAVVSYEQFLAAGPPQALAKNAQTGIERCKEAIAQEPPPTAASTSRATALLEHGRLLAKQGDHAGACDDYQHSLALEPAPETEVELGACQERLGHFADAWRRFDDAATRFDATHAEVDAKAARGRRDALASKTATIVVKLADPSVAVSVAGRDVPGAAEIHERVDPGMVEVHAGAASRTVQAAADASTVVDFTAGDAPVAHPHDEPPPPPPAGDTHPVPVAGRRSLPRLVAYTAGIAGVVAGGVGLGLGLDARSSYNATLDSTECMRSGPAGALSCGPAGERALESAITNANIASGLVIASAVLIVGGVVLYIAAPKHPVVVAPTATASSASVTVAGSF